MNSIGNVANGYISVSSGASNATAAARTALDEMGETKSGKKTGSFAGYIKKVANRPINFVKKHPKATIVTGIVTTALAALTGSVPLVVCGFGLLASGTWACYSNHKEQVKSELAEMKESLEAIKTAQNNDIKNEISG